MRAIRRQRTSTGSTTGKRVIITEKPSMGRAVAAALGVSTRHTGYLEGSNDIVTWWLDWSALPERLLWARLERLPDSAVVKDCDGHLHRFADVSDAKRWLMEDEYTELSVLISDGEVAPSTLPPQDF